MTANLLIILRIALRNLHKNRLARLIAGRNLNSRRQSVLTAVVGNRNISSRVENSRQAAKPHLSSILNTLLILLISFLLRINISRKTLLSTADRLLSAPLLTILTKQATAGGRLIQDLLQAADAGLTLTPQKSQQLAATNAATIQIISQIRKLAANSQAITSPTNTTDLTRLGINIILITSLTSNDTTTHISITSFTKQRARLDMNTVLNSRLGNDADKADSLNAARQTRLSNVGRNANQSILRQRIITQLSVDLDANLSSITLLSTLQHSSMTLLTVYRIRRNSANKTIQVMLSLNGLNKRTILIPALRVSRAMLALITTTTVAKNSATMEIAATNLKLLTGRQLLEHEADRLKRVQSKHITTTYNHQLVGTSDRGMILPLAFLN